MFSCTIKVFIEKSTFYKMYTAGITVLFCHNQWVVWQLTQIRMEIVRINPKITVEVENE